MKDDLVSIFKISGSYRRREIWHGSTTTHELIGRSSIEPDKELSRRERYNVIVEWLKKWCDIIGPAYEPTKAELVKGSKSNAE